MIRVKIIGERNKFIKDNIIISYDEKVYKIFITWFTFQDKKIMIYARQIYSSLFFYSASFFFFCKKYNIRRDVYNEKLMYLYNTQTTILLLILFFWLHSRPPHLSYNRTHVPVHSYIYVCNETCICRPTTYSYRHLVEYRYSTRVSQEEDNSTSYSNPSWHICSWKKLQKTNIENQSCINVIRRSCTLSFRAFR